MLEQVTFPASLRRQVRQPSFHTGHERFGLYTLISLSDVGLEPAFVVGAALRFEGNCEADGGKSAPWPLVGSTIASNSSKPAPYERPVRRNAPKPQSHRGLNLHPCLL
jgi:hypothetical protein